VQASHLPGACVSYYMRSRSRSRRQPVTTATLKTSLAYKAYALRHMGGRRCGAEKAKQCRGCSSADVEEGAPLSASAHGRRAPGRCAAAQRPREAAQATRQRVKRRAGQRAECRGSVADRARQEVTAQATVELRTPTHTCTNNTHAETPSHGDVLPSPLQVDASASAEPQMLERGCAQWLAAERYAPRASLQIVVVAVQCMARYEHALRTWHGNGADAATPFQLHRPPPSAAAPFPCTRHPLQTIVEGNECLCV
jgi:hypothetical protein